MGTCNESIRGFIPPKIDNQGIMSNFIKRLFHLLIGEMNITLDDVSSLLHILIIIQF